MSLHNAARRRGWTRKQKRLAIIAGLALILGLATALVLSALRDQIVFFYAPTDLMARAIEPGRPIRLGGLVKAETWRREGETHFFIVTDGTTDIAAQYSGILPDLFREGQGVVAEGRMEPDGTFTATNVLAKHDENYVPREVVEALKAQGEWRPEGGGAP